MDPRSLEVGRGQDPRTGVGLIAMDIAEVLSNMVQMLPAIHA
jgi:hypothetical protein